MMKGLGDILLRAALFVALLPGVFSCTVKEDRTECPVYVTVLVDRFVAAGETAGVVSFSSGSLINREAINFLDYLRDGYLQPCPRDYARASVVSSVDKGIFMEEAYIVPTGRMCDPVWAYGESFSVNADEYVIDAVPHKQYCKVQFLFDDKTTAPDDYMWRFRIRAEYAGFNVYTMEPVPGDYNCPVGPNAVGEWYGIIPRQRENNMKLEIYLPYADDETQGPTDYVIDLGKAFEEKGYNWYDEDLKDVQVKVGFASNEITLSIEDWVPDDTYRNTEI